MSIGKVIALLTEHCANIDDLLMVKNVDTIEIKDNEINIYFTDGNTADYKIYSDNTWEYLNKD